MSSVFLLTSFKAFSQTYDRVVDVFEYQEEDESLDFRLEETHLEGEEANAFDWRQSFGQAAYIHSFSFRFLDAQTKGASRSEGFDANRVMSVQIIHHNGSTERFERTGIDYAANAFEISELAFERTYSDLDDPYSLMFLQTTQHQEARDLRIYWSEQGGGDCPYEFSEWELPKGKYTLILQDEKGMTVMIRRIKVVESGEASNDDFSKYTEIKVDCIGQ